jgi:ABC-type sugar transport system ATPase subunit
VIRAVELRKRLGEFELNHVSFEVAEGAYAVLLGPTGCGKTVLLETLVGINRPDEGQVWLDGQDVTDVAPERRGIGFVYQRSMLFPHLSVRQNVAYGLRYHGVPRSEYAARVGRVATLLGIGHLLERGVGALSGGEMQKVALGRALAIEPRVLLLDEPLAALDPVSKEALRTQLAAIHRQTGTTILHVTHDQEEARVLGQTVGVMRAGALLQFGPKDEVFDHPGSAFVARFVGTENVFRGRATREGRFVRVELGCGTVLAEAEMAGWVGLCVRPEQIAIEAATAPTSISPNHVEGIVESVSDRGPLVRYQVVTAQEPFVVLQTKKDYAAAGAAVGQRVALSFEPSGAHVFPWEAEPEPADPEEEP